MTVYRKSFPEGAALLVHRFIEGSKDPNVLKRAQAVYCRAAFDLPLEQIAGLTGLAVSTIRRLHSEFLRFGMEIFDLSGRGGRRRQIMTPEEEVTFLQPFIEAGDAGGILEVGKVHDALCERTGRRIHRSVTYKLLHRHNWRKIVPRSRHPRADQEAQASFKKTGRTL